MRLKLPWDSRMLGAPMIRPLRVGVMAPCAPQFLPSQSALRAAFHSLSKGTHELSVTHAPFVPREYISRHNGAHLNSIPSVLKT